jgi:hypothetical protein
MTTLDNLNDTNTIVTGNSNNTLYVNDELDSFLVQELEQSQHHHSGVSIASGLGHSGLSGGVNGHSGIGVNGAIAATLPHHITGTTAIAAITLPSLQHSALLSRGGANCN